jgi:hypothetical protein
MAGRGLPMAIYVVRVATRTVNGDGCHEAMSLKGTHDTRSTDRRHHQFILGRKINDNIVKTPSRFNINGY